MGQSLPSIAGRRVLLVEDEYFIADDMRRVFEAEGLEVIGPVASVEGALDLIAGTETIDGAVLDINLRDVMVYPVADLLQARGVPLVFATGYDRSTIPARFSAVRHCEKPVEPIEIVRALFP